MSRTRDLPWLILPLCLVVAGLGYRLDAYPLLDPDEGRNAEVAREIAAANDYVVPRLNGVPYADKPILYFAAGALTMEVLGPTVLAARLPSLLFTLLTLGMTAWFGRRLFGPAGGWTAGIATGSTPLTLAFSRTVIFDAALTCFVTAALIAFFMAAEDGSPAADQTPSDTAAWWSVAAWAAMALGVLTKGPIALAIPLMVVVPYLAWRRRLWPLLDPLALLACVALILPWLFAVSARMPGFLEHALVTETAKRLFTDELQRSEPFWYFFPVLAAGALPWSFVLFSGWRRAPTIREAGGYDRRVIFLLAWIVIPLLFFTLSQSKRPQYVVPMIPAVGLAVAFLWSGPSRPFPGSRITATLLAGTAGAIMAAPVIVPRLLATDPAIAATIPTTSLGLGIVVLAAAAGTWYAAENRHLVLLALSLPVSAIPFLSTRLMQAIGRDRSAEAVAMTVRPLLTPSTEVVAVETYPLSLPFYLQTPLVVTTGDGSELTSNYITGTYPTWRDVPGSPFRPVDWWLDALATCNRPRIFVVAAENARVRHVLEMRIALLIETRKWAAYGPCVPTSLASRSPTPRQ